MWDFSERFKADVVDDFIAEYSAGRTPNPCMRCNERIKFAALLENYQQRDGSLALPEPLAARVGAI